MLEIIAGKLQVGETPLLATHERELPLSLSPSSSLPFSLTRDGSGQIRSALPKYADFLHVRVKCIIRETCMSESRSSVGEHGVKNLSHRSLQICSRRGFSMLMNRIKG